MKTKFISALLSSLVMFGLAGLFTGVLAREFIARNAEPEMLRAPPNLVLTYLGYLALALLMAFAYQYFAKSGTKSWISGLKLGLATALVWLIPYSLVLFSVYKFPYAAIPMDFGWVLVEQGLGGLVVGLVQGSRANI